MADGPHGAAGVPRIGGAVGRALGRVWAAGLFVKLWVAHGQVAVVVGKAVQAVTDGLCVLRCGVVRVVHGMAVALVGDAVVVASAVRLSHVPLSDPAVHLPVELTGWDAEGNGVLVLLEGGARFRLGTCGALGGGEEVLAVGEGAHRSVRGHVDRYRESGVGRSPSNVAVTSDAAVTRSAWRRRAARCALRRSALRSVSLPLRPPDQLGRSHAVVR